MKIVGNQPLPSTPNYSPVLSRLLAACMRREVRERPTAHALLSVSVVAQRATELGLSHLMPRPQDGLPSYAAVRRIGAEGGTGGGSDCGENQWHAAFNGIRAGGCGGAPRVPSCAGGHEGLAAEAPHAPLVVNARTKSPPRVGHSMSHKSLPPAFQMMMQQPAFQKQQSPFKSQVDLQLQQLQLQEPHDGELAQPTARLFDNGLSARHEGRAARHGAPGGEGTPCMLRRTAHGSGNAVDGARVSWDIRPVLAERSKRTSSTLKSCHGSSLSRGPKRS